MIAVLPAQSKWFKKYWENAYNISEIHAQKIVQSLWYAYLDHYAMVNNLLPMLAVIKKNAATEKYTIKLSHMYEYEQ